MQQEGDTLIHVVAKFGSVQFCKYLVEERKINPNAMNMVNDEVAVVLVVAVEDDKESNSRINLFRFV